MKAVVIQNPVVAPFVPHDSLNVRGKERKKEKTKKKDVDVGVDTNNTSRRKLETGTPIILHARSGPNHRPEYAKKLKSTCTHPHPHNYRNLRPQPPNIPWNMGRGTKTRWFAWEPRIFFSIFLHQHKHHPSCILFLSRLTQTGQAFLKGDLLMIILLLLLVAGRASYSRNTFQRPPLLFYFILFYWARSPIVRSEIH